MRSFWARFAASGPLDEPGSDVCHGTFVRVLDDAPGSGRSEAILSDRFFLSFPFFRVKNLYNQASHPFWKGTFLGKDPFSPGVWSWILSHPFGAKMIIFVVGERMPVIRELTKKEEWIDAFPLMKELRPHLDLDDLPVAAG